MKAKFKQLLKEKEDVLQQMGILNSRLCAIKYEIEQSCEHRDVMKRTSYSYGGYGHQGEDRSWDECSHCGKTFNLKIRLTGFG